jgi:rhodanese-related sulfurtransferase
MTEILQEELLSEIDEEKPPVIIDVRSGFEYNSGHIRHAVHIPFYAIFWNKKRLPKDKNELLVLTCEHGPRAVIARRLLGIIGHRNVRLLKGHMVEWKKKHLPVYLR